MECVTPPRRGPATRPQLLCINNLKAQARNFNVRARARTCRMRCQARSNRTKEVMRRLQTVDRAEERDVSAKVEKVNDLQAAIERVIKGKPEAVRLAIVTLI